MALGDDAILLALNEYTLGVVRSDFPPRINAVLQDLHGSAAMLRLEVGTLHRKLPPDRDFTHAVRRVTRRPCNSSGLKYAGVSALSAGVARTVRRKQAVVAE